MNNNIREDIRMSWTICINHFKVQSSRKKNTTLNLQIQYITTVWFKSSSVLSDGPLLPPVTSSNLLTRKSDRGAPVRNPFFRSGWFQYWIQIILAMHTNLRSALGGKGTWKKKYIYILYLFFCTRAAESRQDLRMGPRTRLR